MLQLRLFNSCDLSIDLHFFAHIPFGFGLPYQRFPPFIHIAPITFCHDLCIYSQYIHTNKNPYFLAVLWDFRNV